jgi:hypothetical protein
VWVGNEKPFISAQDVLFESPGDRFLGRESIGAETVIVEQKKRDQTTVRSLARPKEVGVFRCRHISVPAQFDEVTITGFPPETFGVFWLGPEFVVSGNPEDLGETLVETVETPGKEIGIRGDVAGQDQPVLRVVREILDRAT